MNCTTEWFRNHPWIATSFCAGAFVGILACFPLIPYTLPESSANLIGSALGAGVAVWGAAWVAEGRERRNRRTAKVEIHGTFSLMLEAIDEVVLATKDASKDRLDEREAELIPLGEAFAALYSAAQIRFDEMQPLFQ